MRTLIVVPVLLALGAYSPAAGGSNAAPQAQEWIDVDLTPNTFREYSSGYRTDTIDIPIFAYFDLEYKLAMKEGASIVYTWEVLEMEEPELLTSEFHGHTEPEPGAPGTVMFYRKATGGTESGALIAPFDGIHGWYFLNDSDEPVVVRLQVAGFYELVPD